MGTATNNSKSLAEVSAERWQGTQALNLTQKDPASERAEGEGGREGSRHPPAPTAAEETKPATDCLKPRPGQGAVSPRPSRAGRSTLPEQAWTPPWSQSPHNTDWRDSARTVCHSTRRPDPSGSRHRRRVDTRCIMGAPPPQAPQEERQRLLLPRGVSVAPLCARKGNSSLEILSLSVGCKRKDSQHQRHFLDLSAALREIL